MVNVLKIMVSAFCDKKIQPTPETISTLMSKINDYSKMAFLPNVFSTQKINILNGAVEGENNLSFATADKKSQIICANDRIDCSVDINADNEEEIDSKIKLCAGLLSLLMEKEQIKAKRLAFNADYVSSPISDYRNLINQMIQGFKYYNGKEIKEWSSRINAKGTMELNGVEELNIITKYSEGKLVGTEDVCIICHTDINTVFENKAFRFDNSSVELFTEQAKDIFSQLTTDVEGIVS